jgi:hypothetical protein
MQHGACHPKYAEHLKEGLLNQSCISHKFTSGENENQRMARKKTEDCHTQETDTCCLLD